MRRYNTHDEENNGQLGFEFITLPNQRPTEMAIRRLIAATGMSPARARATLEAYDPRHD